MSGTDLIAGLWLALNLTTLALTAHAGVTEWRELRAIEAEVRAGRESPELLIVAQRDLTQSGIVILIAALYVLVGVVALALVHHWSTNPLLLAVYTLAFLTAAALLLLKQAQRQLARRRVRRLYLSARQEPGQGQSGPESDTASETETT